jgi:hypothetical protein
LRAPNEQDCDKEIDGSVLCYAGRACFVLQARVSAGVGDFTLPTQMTGSSLIVPRLIKEAGGRKPRRSQARLLPRTGSPAQ